MTNVDPLEQKATPSSTRQLRLLTRTTLLRKIYRVLLNTGRSYAAFTEKEWELLRTFEKEEILDPMSGYGSLTRYCAEHGLKSYCVEFNLPQHLWQVLCHPQYSGPYIDCCQLLLSWKRRWPRIRMRGMASDEWFTLESQKILLELHAMSREATKKCFDSSLDQETLASALLLPFVGRLSCSVPGDIVTHVKKGGICVYIGWQEDLELYFKALIRNLERFKDSSACKAHTIIHADARTFAFPKERFSAMLTSPPYPNHRDFVSMFSPEHAFLDMLNVAGSVTSRRASVDIIGSNFVSERPRRVVRSRKARHFLKSVTELKRNRTQIRHDNQYYIPYFENYFADLEDAYRNIASALGPGVKGYIVVVNNTHRNLLVPVSDVVIEIWRVLGFEASIWASTEAFHVGTKNPRARGLRARHTEHVIKIWRP